MCLRDSWRASGPRPPTVERHPQSQVVLARESREEAFPPAGNTSYVGSPATAMAYRHPMASRTMMRYADDAFGEGVKVSRLHPSGPRGQADNGRRVLSTRAISTSRQAHDRLGLIGSASCSVPLLGESAQTRQVASARNRALGRIGGAPRQFEPEAEGIARTGALYLAGRALEPRPAGAGGHNGWSS